MIIVDNASFWKSGTKIIQSELTTKLVFLIIHVNRVNTTQTKPLSSQPNI